MSGKRGPEKSTLAAHYDDIYTRAHTHTHTHTHTYIYIYIYIYIYMCVCMCLYIQGVSKNATYEYDNNLLLRHYSMLAGVRLCLIWFLYGYNWRSFLFFFLPRCTFRSKYLGTSSEGLFPTPSNRISHHIHIIKITYSQLSARSGVFCILVEVVYLPCSLEFVYPTINLAVLGIIDKVKFPAQFCLYSFKWFLALNK